MKRLELSDRGWRPLATGPAERWLALRSLAARLLRAGARCVDSWAVGCCGVCCAKPLPGAMSLARVARHSVSGSAAIHIYGAHDNFAS